RGDLKSVKEDLRRLLEAYRANRPEDPEGPSKEGELYLAEGRYDRAEAAFAEAARLAADEPLRERIRVSRVYARYRAGKGLSAYPEMSRTRQTFEQLASLYAADRKGKELLALVEVRRKDAPGDRGLPAREAEGRWLTGDYAGALKLLEEHR